MPRGGAGALINLLSWVLVGASVSQWAETVHDSCHLLAVKCTTVTANPKSAFKCFTIVRTGHFHDLQFRLHRLITQRRKRWFDSAFSIKNCSVQKPTVHQVSVCVFNWTGSTQNQSRMVAGCCVLLNVSSTRGRFARTRLLLSSCTHWSCLWRRQEIINITQKTE